MCKAVSLSVASLAVVGCLTLLVSTPSLTLAQAEALSEPATPFEPAMLPAAELAGPLQAPYRVYGGEGALRHLSFSTDAQYLAVSTTADRVLVFDLARVTDSRPVWSWSYPETLKTSVGEILWPWSPWARATWSTGRWGLYGPKEEGGWPGDAGAVFAPSAHDTYELAVVHDPCWSNTHLIVASEPGGETAPAIEVKEGIWLLGGYVHVFSGGLAERTVDGDAALALRTSIETEVPLLLPSERSVFGGLPAVTVVDFTADGRTMAAGSSDGVVTLWDFKTGTNLGRWRVSEPGCPVTDLDFSPDDRQLATVREGGAVKVWDLPTQAQTAEYRGGDSDCYWVEFAPDGSRLAAASWDGSLRVWDLKTRELQWDLYWAREIGDQPIFAFGNDSRYLLFGSGRAGRGILGAVDLDRQRVSTICNVDMGTIKVFALSPRGELLAAGDETGRVMVWMLRPGMLAAGQ